MPKAGGAGFVRGPMWGVPIVTKANTSVKGLVTTDGWKGYTIPGHELVAPKDATIVAKLRAAGAIIIGQTNMPDFAASDTNRSTAYGRTGNAYDVRFSPGGSSGGTVTSVTSNFAVLGNGTDTGNSIRMPAATSSVVGVFPNRGLVSIAGIAPLDWLLDNTGPIARDVTDAAIALGVMAGEDPLDPRTIGSAAKAQPGPYTQYLKGGRAQRKTLRRSRFHSGGSGHSVSGHARVRVACRCQERHRRCPASAQAGDARAFMKSLDGLRAAGATVVFDDSILPDSFAVTVARVGTVPYIREGTEKFLAEFGPAQYHSADEYLKAVGSPLPATIIGGVDKTAPKRRPPPVQAVFETDPKAEANVLDSAAKGARSLQRNAGSAAPRRLCLSGYANASARRDDGAGREDQRWSAQRYGMGEHDRCSSGGGSRRILSGGSPVRLRDFGALVERWRFARLGVCV
jgi:amidase